MLAPAAPTYQSPISARLLACPPLAQGPLCRKRPSPRSADGGGYASLATPPCERYFEMCAVGPPRSSTIPLYERLRERWWWWWWLLTRETVWGETAGEHTNLPHGGRLLAQVGHGADKLAGRRRRARHHRQRPRDSDGCYAHQPPRGTIPSLCWFVFRVLLRLARTELWAPRWSHRCCRRMTGAGRLLRVGRAAVT